MRGGWRRWKKCSRDSVREFVEKFVAKGAAAVVAGIFVEAGRARRIPVPVPCRLARYRQSLRRSPYLLLVRRCAWRLPQVLLQPRLVLLRQRLRSRSARRQRQLRRSKRRRPRRKSNQRGVRRAF